MQSNENSLRVSTHLYRGSCTLLHDSGSVCLIPDPRPTDSPGVGSAAPGHGSARVAHRLVACHIGALRKPLLDGRSVAAHSSRTSSSNGVAAASSLRAQRVEVQQVSESPTVGISSSEDPIEFASQATIEFASQAITESASQAVTDAASQAATGAASRAAAVPES